MNVPPALRGAPFSFGTSCAMFSVAVKLIGAIDGFAKATAATGRDEDGDAEQNCDSCAHVLACLRFGGRESSVSPMRLFAFTSRAVVSRSVGGDPAPPQPIAFPAPRKRDAGEDERQAHDRHGAQRLAKQEPAVEDRDPGDRVGDEDRPRRPGAPEQREQRSCRRPRCRRGRAAATEPSPSSPGPPRADGRCRAAP